MPPIPEDVREAASLKSEPERWIRLRAGVGSLVGETFMFRDDDGIRVVSRASALAPLVELTPSSPLRFEEDTMDAAVIVPTAEKEERIGVGYLERDAVRAFFEPEPPVVIPAVAAEPPVAADAAVEVAAPVVAVAKSPETAARTKLVSTLSRRVEDRRKESKAKAAVAATAAKRRDDGARRAAPVPTRAEPPRGAGDPAARGRATTSAQKPPAKVAQTSVAADVRSSFDKRVVVAAALAMALAVVVKLITAT
jgi:hypothetical protein